VSPLLGIWSALFTTILDVFPSFQASNIYIFPTFLHVWFLNIFVLFLAFSISPRFAVSACDTGDDLPDRPRAARELLRQQPARAVRRHGRLP